MNISLTFLGSMDQQEEKKTYAVILMSQAKLKTCMRMATLKRKIKASTKLMSVHEKVKFLENAEFWD